MSDEIELRQSEREAFVRAFFTSIIMEHADEINRALVGFARIVQGFAVASFNWINAVEREHKEQLKRRALDQRSRWRKADVPRLLRLDVGAEPAERMDMAKLLEGGGPRGGRGVVPEPETLGEEIVDFVTFGQKLFGPDTPPNVRCALYKQTRWWPYFVEAAYRGELREARESLRGGRLNDRHGATPSEIAKEAVAEAANISLATVHALCQRVRNERGSAEPDDPEMTASELRAHIEEGPAEVRCIRVSRTLPV